MQFGIIRRIDKAGRVVIPKEIREFFGLKEFDPVEIIATEQGIILKVPECEVFRKA